MFVINRNGQKENVRYDKITDRNIELASDLDVDVARLSQLVIQSLKDGMTTSQIDDLSAETAFFMSTHQPQYDTLSVRIAVSNLHKSTKGSFVEVCRLLNSNINPDTEKRMETLNDELMAFVEQNATILDNTIDYKKDYSFSYFGLKTLEKTYLQRINGKVVERPQHLLMRVAVAIHGPYNDIEKVIHSYQLMSQGLFTHASPTLFNAGSKRAQFSSCFLLKTDDDLDHIFETVKRCGLISKYGGGIGVDISSVRAKGSTINSTNGKSDGIVPMVKVFNASSVYSNQCFLPDVSVYSMVGKKRMDEVTTDDYLITIDGSFKKVNEVIVNEKDEEVYHIKITGGFDLMKCTGEHDIYTIKDLLKCPRENIMERLKKGKCKPEFIPASELKPKYFVGFPIPTHEQDHEKLTTDICRFYGLMLGDGSIIFSEKGSNRYQLCLNNESKIESVNFVKEFLTSKEIHYWISNECEIGWTYNEKNIEKTQIDYDMLYDENKEKRVDPRFLWLPKNKTSQVLRGLLDSDGSVTDTGIFIWSTSKNLIYSSRIMFLRFGLLTSTQTIDKRGQTLSYNKKGKPIISRRLSYSLRIPKMDSLKQDGIFFNFVPQQKQTIFYNYNNILFTRITSIHTEQYKGKVYDFNMKDNHNYLTDAGLVHNSGRRKGSFAMYLQPWHPDIFEFISLRANNPPEDLRARDIFLGLWIPDIFMRRVEEDGVWSLFCPSKVKGLTETYGEEFDKIYIEAEQAGKFNRQVKARDVWQAILTAQQETGLPYILYKDHINNKSNQKNIGIIRSSNLCVSGDTKIFTRKGEVEISEVVDQEIDVWNGLQWTTVTPRKTGENQPLLELRFSNDARVKCTPYHKVPIVDDYEKPHRMIDANEVEPGMKLQWFTIPIPEPGTEDDYRARHRLQIDITVCSNEPVDGLHDVYCFTDEKRGMGLFNGIQLGNCAEIVEYTDNESVSVCNLSSIAVSRFVTKSKNGNSPSFDWDLLGKVVEQCIENLNRIIDLNFYPVEASKTNNLKYRPVGLGIQGLSDLFAIFKVAWGSEEARWLNRIISEVMYYHALKKSAELSQVEGPYTGFEGSPVSQGILQYHMWNERPWTDAEHPNRSNIPSNLQIPTLDWKSLIESCKKGVRNSLLIAMMPTASTAQILGNNEGCEAITSNIYSRSVLAGDFMVVNKHLYNDLNEIGLWTKSIVNQIIADDGSIQSITDIPQEIKDVYKTVWEISQKHVIDYAADRGAFVDQTQSMNIFMAHPTSAALSSMHLYGWKKGLKTGMYYLRSKPSRGAVKFSLLPGSKTDTKEKETKKAKFVCTEEVCTMCSS